MLMLLYILTHRHTSLLKVQGFSRSYIVQNSIVVFKIMKHPQCYLFIFENENTGSRVLCDKPGFGVHFQSLQISTASWGFSDPWHDMA